MCMWKYQWKHSNFLWDNERHPQFPLPLSQWSNICFILKYISSTLTRVWFFGSAQVIPICGHRGLLEYSRKRELTIKVAPFCHVCHKVDARFLVNVKSGPCFVIAPENWQVEVTILHCLFSRFSHRSLCNFISFFSLLCYAMLWLSYCIF